MTGGEEEEEDIVPPFHARGYGETVLVLVVEDGRFPESHEEKEHVVHVTFLLHVDVTHNVVQAIAIGKAWEVGALDFISP